MTIVCDITNLDRDLPLWQEKLLDKELTDPKAKAGDLQFILEIFPHAETTALNPPEYPELQNGDVWSLDTFLSLKEPMRFSSTSKEDLFLDRSTMEDIELAGMRYRIVYTGTKIRDFIQKYGLQRYSDAGAQKQCMDILFAGQVVPMQVVDQLVQKYKEIKDDAEQLCLL